jgi:thiamine-phosphate pyrophosphorylase
MEIDYSLYLVTDQGLLGGLPLSQAIKEAVAGGVTLVQLREKDSPTGTFYKTALEVKQVTDACNVPLIINDRVDIALAVDATGFHTGQGDLPASVARRILGKNKILGVSAVSPEEAVKAEQDGADYIGAGAVFPTDTKKDAGMVSLETLKAITKAVHIPVIAIGGIQEWNAELLKGTGIKGIAVISAILGKKDIRQASGNLKDKLASIQLFKGR